MYIKILQIYAGDMDHLKGHFMMFCGHVKEQKKKENWMQIHARIQKTLKYN